MQLWRKIPSPLPAAAPEAPAAPAWPKSPRPWVHVALFGLTLLSMMAAGAMQQGVDPLVGLGSLVHLSEGIPFAATLLAILTVHEFGHYFAARRWGVRASLPYFLPMPPYVSFLGTLGAVIRIRSPIPHKRALLDIGAAGPLAGFVVAVAACAAGLAQSSVVEAGYFSNPPIELGAPLLFGGLARLILPEVGPEQLVLLSPVAFAGWVGLFITAFNLFPIGQLDGGHIVYALFGRRHRQIGRLSFVLLLGMGVYGILSLLWGWPRGWPGWLVLSFLLVLLGRDHPPPYNPYIPLDPARRRAGYFCLLIFALCLTPTPFGQSF